MVLRALFSFFLYLTSACAFGQDCILPLADSSFSVVENSTIIFVGEKHRQPCDYPFQLQLFQHFNKIQNRQHLLIEYGPSFGYLIQEFIETGDLDIYHEMKFFGFGQEVLFDWIKNLEKEYKNKTIQIYGVDVENQPVLMLYSIYRIYKRNGIEDSRLSDFTKRDTIPNERTNDLATLFLNDFRNNENMYKDQLSKDFNKVSHIFDNFDSALKYYYLREIDSVETAYKFREGVMTNNIRKVVYSNDSAAKYFGQFGHIHTAQRPISNIQQITNWESTALLLLKKHGINSSSIGIIYSDELDHMDYQLFGKELNLIDPKPEAPIIVPSKIGVFNYLIGY
ncbi:MAG: hypothetical protein JKY42_00715 [Flavobacteriales bacterium]|nr:hypothetical protein [Flavobacteriales bacterium]